MISIINEKTITDWIISQDQAGLTSHLMEEKISFEGRFGMVRKETQNGTSTVTLYIGDGTRLQYDEKVLVAGDQKNGTKTFDLNTNATGNPENTGMSIFPNPTRGQFTVSLNQFQDAVFSIYNLMGVCVKKGVINGQRVIDMSDCQSGIYVLKFKTGHEIVSRKIVLTN